MISKFVRSETGNVAVIGSLMALPLMAAVGMAVDYSLATTTRSDMQNALDAAAFATFTMSATATQDELAKALQDAYVANGGRGQASLVGDIVTNSLSSTLKVKADTQMQTGVMGMFGYKKMPLHVDSTVSKPVKLTSLQFRLNKVTGAFDKTVTLMGRTSSTAPYAPLLRMTYVATNIGGWGATTLSTPPTKGAKWNDFQTITCSSLTTCATSVLSGDGTAGIDVANMEDVYLQMDMSAIVGKPYWYFTKKVVTFKSNDPATSDQMFVAGKQTPKGETINMVQAVGCANKWMEHRWEDAGGWEGAASPWDGTDFQYFVKGQCSSSGSSVRLTQ